MRYAIEFAPTAPATARELLEAPMASAIAL
jgi:hypothetical protein